MKTLYLLCGLSFSGKSSLARALREELSLEVVSLDAINDERGVGFGGEGLSVEIWEQTNAIAGERFAALASSGRDVVIDDTNCFRWLRDRWRDRASAVGYATRVLYVDTPVTEIRRRQAQNARSGDRRGIRDEVFAEHVRTFEPPGPDEEVFVLQLGDDVLQWVRQLAS